VGSNPTPGAETNPVSAEKLSPGMFGLLSCEYTIQRSNYVRFLGLSSPSYEPEEDQYLRYHVGVRTERTHMITAIDEIIEEARKKAKYRRAPANERIRWTRLAGQLIWYKDSILRSITQEAMERELIVLKQQVLAKIRGKTPAWLHILRPATHQI